MINDDVVATIKIQTELDKIQLFNLPLSKKSSPFKIYPNTDLRFADVLKDSYDCVINY